MPLLRQCLLLFAVVSISSAADSKPLVMLLGDSIRMNYQQVVKAELKDQAEVWSPKDNCRHTFYVLENLDRWFTEAGREPKVVHINVGLHDMYLTGGKTRHTLPVYENNLRAIFTKLREKSDARIIFAVTTAVNEDRQARSKGYRRVVRRNSDVDRFNSAAKKIAQDMNVAVNDLNAFMKQNGPDKILRESDGIHLSPGGCQSVGVEVANEIRQRLK